MFYNFKRFIETIIIKQKFKKSGGKIEKPHRVRGYQGFYIGKNVQIRKDAGIECLSYFGGQEYNPKLKIEDNVIIGRSFKATITDTLEIGADTIIAHNVTIVTENHGINPESNIPYAKQALSSKPIHIGKNCWIGANVCILPGGNLGDNCIVAANAIVNKSFPSNVMIGGIPAKIIKIYDFENHQWVLFHEKSTGL